jgi:hypothetical protein
MTASRHSRKDCDVAAPRRNVGTKSPSYRAVDGSGGVKTTPTKGSKGGKPSANAGNKGSGGGKKKKGGKKNYNYNVAALNPPFDPRMRQIGNPLHNSKGMKRGWVQSTEDNLRVNFLFNPSQFDLQHGVNTDLARNPDYTPNDDVMDVSYASMGSSGSIKLLYDRTYELLSTSNTNFASKYGVWADVAAWYVLLGMLPEMPSDWKDSMITAPATIKQVYLFIGLRMVYYGWLTGVNVTYSHWNQQMVPVRCSVDLSFELLPHVTGDTPLPAKYRDEEVEQSILNDFHHTGGYAPDWGV